MGWENWKWGQANTKVGLAKDLQRWQRLALHPADREACSRRELPLRRTGTSQKLIGKSISNKCTQYAHWCQTPNRLWYCTLGAWPRARTSHHKLAWQEVTNTTSKRPERVELDKAATERWRSPAQGLVTASPAYRMPNCKCICSPRPEVCSHTAWRWGCWGTSNIHCHYLECIKVKSNLS